MNRFRLWRVIKLKQQSLFSSTRPPRFVICTGDLLAHYFCADSCYLPPDKKASHITNLQVILADLRNLFAVWRIPLFVAPRCGISPCLLATPIH